MIMLPEQLMKVFRHFFAPRTNLPLAEKAGPAGMQLLECRGFLLNRLHCQGESPEAIAHCLGRLGDQLLETQQLASAIGTQLIPMSHMVTPTAKGALTKDDILQLLAETPVHRQVADQACILLVE